MKEDWFKLENTDEIITPCLVVFPKRILHNIKLMFNEINYSVFKKKKYYNKI